LHFIFLKKANLKNKRLSLRFEPALPRFGATAAQYDAQRKLPKTSLNNMMSFLVDVSSI